jgi:hypothetical protein
LRQRDDKVGVERSVYLSARRPNVRGNFLGMCLPNSWTQYATDIVCGGIDQVTVVGYIRGEANWTSAITSYIAFWGTGRLISLANAQTYPFDNSIPTPAKPNSSLSQRNSFAEVTRAPSTELFLTQGACFDRSPSSFVSTYFLDKPR